MFTKKKATPKKKGNNHSKKFKFQRKNNQGNTYNPFGSRNGTNKGFKKQGKFYSYERKSHYKIDCYDLRHG